MNLNEIASGSVGIVGAGMMEGGIAVLNVGAGDLTLSFDPKNPAERIRAARIVKDMIRRGYSLLVEVERDGQKGFVRAHDFDEEQCVYIIADFDPTVEAKPVVRLEGEHEEEAGGEGKQEAASKAGVDSQSAAPGKRRVGKTRVPAESTRAVSVGKTAGG